jgi:hypothetical protein
MMHLTFVPWTHENAATAEDPLAPKLGGRPDTDQIERSF